MTHLALVVEWQLPDDADHNTADVTLRALLDKIHANSPTPAERVTAYLGVSAELIAEAASTGAIVEQASRLQLAPGDVVTIRPPSDLNHFSAAEFQAYSRQVKAAFPHHQVVVLEGDATIEASPAEEAATS
jgi:hypothetical protein